MAHRCRAVTVAFTGLVWAGVALAGSVPAVADPADPTPAPVIVPDAPPPPPPPPVSNDPMTPRQAPVPAAAPSPAAPAPGPDPGVPGTPPPPPVVPGPSVPDTVPPPGNSGGGILGSIIDLWHQAQNPFAPPSGGPGVMPAVPAGAGPAPKLPPGYISINAPGSETPSNGPAGGSAEGRPPLPPGYYSLDGPPPPWVTDPAAPATVPGS